MKSRRQNVNAGKAQSKTTKLLYDNRKKKKTDILSSFFSKTATTTKKNLLRFQPQQPYKAGLANNKKSNKSYGT